MLGENKVAATIAVKDIDVAKRFYGETLGLKQISEHPGGVTYDSGGAPLFVYPSGFAGTNQATSASWTVDNLEAVVRELKGNGVVFEHYDE